MKEQKVILDTSIFVNPQARYCFGNSPYDCLENFLDMLAKNKDIISYIPPSVWEELMKFTEKTPPPTKTKVLIKQAPASYQLSLPALFIYELIEETRARTNKGLRIAEKYARQDLSQEAEDTVIKRLRDEYRVALREGIIDSKEDCDLLLLALELKASIATADNGLIKWAQKLGIPCLSSEELKVLVTP